jgi:hypothetical protein
MELRKRSSGTSSMGSRRKSVSAEEALVLVAAAAEGKEGTLAAVVEDVVEAEGKN